ncbi:tail assembly protein [Erwinia tracheiphila]|uniref:Tail assembly protein n=1 Tax=Erwinia tracheiphila TaxID=65700 RepID=A0A345CRH9_9GAMM|nr:tail assembly protein [Erwinia tracheiphila]AXF76046.1 tail assembly protein [Erwinia tracheiphila]UIA85292.1 tail assembly protein [Erwinia tracheiphila]
MLIFRFAGHLRRHFRQVSLNVETPSQGLRLLLAQCPAFKRDFYKTRIRMRVGGTDVSNGSLAFHMDRHLKDGAAVLFVPVIEGALAATGFAVWALVAVTVASVAYSLYMTSHMKTKTSADAAQSGSIMNNSFTSVDNRIGQGRPVPLLLGEMVVGSNVISLGIDTTNNVDWDISIS